MDSSLLFSGWSSMSALLPFSSTQLTAPMWWNELNFRRTTPVLRLHNSMKKPLFNSCHLDSLFPELPWYWMHLAAVLGFDSSCKWSRWPWYGIRGISDREECGLLDGALMTDPMLWQSSSFRWLLMVSTCAYQCRGPLLSAIIPSCQSTTPRKAANSRSGHPFC